MKDKFYNFFKFISEYALYGLLFFIPISISLVEVFAALMFLGFVVRKIMKPDFKFIKFRPNILLFLFLLFNALSLLNSGVYLNISLRALFGKWMLYLGICLIIQDSVYNQKIIRRGINIFLLSAMLVVFSGLSQYLFGVEFLRNKSTVLMDCGMRSITSCFVHYNSFGAYLVVVISLASALLLEKKYFNLKTIGLLALSIFSTIAIMLTFSRGSWMALVISFIFMSIFVRRSFAWVIPIFFAIVALSFFPEIRERLYLIFKTGGDSDRFRYWITALNMIKKHPFFGVGLGTFMANFVKYIPAPVVREAYAHNCYLQIWAETGIFALTSFLIFVVSVIYTGIKKFLISKDFLLLGLLSGAIGFLFHSFFDTNLYSLQLAFLFWVWIGLIIARLRITYNE